MNRGSLIVFGMCLIASPLNAADGLEPVIGGGASGGLEGKMKSSVAVYNSSCTMSVQTKGGELRAVGFIAAHCLQSAGGAAPGGAPGGAPGTPGAPGAPTTVSVEDVAGGGGTEKKSIKFADGRAGTAECKADPSYRKGAENHVGNDFAVCEVTFGGGGAPTTVDDKPGEQTPFCIAKEAPKSGEEVTAVGCAQENGGPKPELCKKGELKVTSTKGSPGTPTAADDVAAPGGSHGGGDAGENKVIQTTGLHNLQKGDSGGPLVNKNGEIVGVNSTSEIRSGGMNTHGMIDMKFVKQFADSRGLKVCVGKGDKGGGAGGGERTEVAYRPHAQTGGGSFAVSTHVSGTH